MMFVTDKLFTWMFSRKILKTWMINRKICLPDNSCSSKSSGFRNWRETTRGASSWWQLTARRARCAPHWGRAGPRTPFTHKRVLRLPPVVSGPMGPCCQSASGPPAFPREKTVFCVVVFSRFFCNPMDCSVPGSSVHGIFWARILEWGAISFSRKSPPPRDWTCVSCIGRQDSSPLSHQGSPCSTCRLT